MKLRRLAHLTAFAIISGITPAYADNAAPRSEASAPQHHEAAYRQFCRTLEQQAKANTRDLAPAALIVLQTTNDEFAMDAWMERAARDGYPAALWYTGSQMIGKVLPNQKQTARVRQGVAQCKKAAEQNFAPAMIDYSQFLQNGIGVHRNEKAAQNMLIKACATGNLEARFYWLTANNKLNSIEDLQRKEVQSEIRRGNHDILFNLHKKCATPEAAMDMAYQAARMGNSKAMYDLFLYLKNSHPIEANQFLEKSAELHNSMALAALAYQYYAPKAQANTAPPRPKDDASAVKLFQLASMTGDLLAHYNLAALYYHGLAGLEKNYQKSYQHIEEALFLAPADAALSAAKGYMMLTGRGVEANPKAGFEEIDKAARQFNPTAIIIHSYVTFKGIGNVPKDAKNACDNLEYMATRGYAPCFIFLALMYEEGAEGVPANPDTAAYYLEQGLRLLGKDGQQLYNFHKNSGKGWQLNPFEFSELPPTTTPEPLPHTRMKLTHILSGILAAGIICAPQVNAAPRKKNTPSKSSNRKKTPSKKQQQQKKQPQEAPKLPDNPHAPQHHEQTYRTFFSQLQEIAKNNGQSLAKPFLTILQATDDEFCVNLWMQRACDEGNPVAQLYTAKKALVAIPKKDLQSQKTRQAVVLIKKAADQHYAPAMLEYSICLREGIGFSANEAAADKELMQACAGGDFRTRFHWLLQNGRLQKFTDLNLPEVKAELKRGNHYILHHIALLAPTEELMQKTLEHAAKMGSDAALYENHVLQLNTNITESYNNLTKAVRLHNPYAIHAMGRYYLDPPMSLELNVGAIRSPKEGITFLKIAALLGVADAHADLAQFYYNGQHGMAKDVLKAYLHTEAGAQLSGDPKLVSAQGFMQLSGDGTTKNTQEGLGRLQLAAKAGYAHAKELLAYAHFRGIGTEQNSSQAIYYLEDAATGKDPFAFIYLALMYDEGAPGLPADREKVAYYLGHAEQAAPGKSQALFDYFKRRYKKWVMTPFPEHYF